MQRETVSNLSLMILCKWMLEQVVIVNIQTLLRATNNMKLWRTMITHVVKDHCPLYASAIWLWKNGHYQFCNGCNLDNVLLAPLQSVWICLCWNFKCNFRSIMRFSVDPYMHRLLTKNCFRLHNEVYYIKTSSSDEHFDF